LLVFFKEIEINRNEGEASFELFVREMVSEVRACNNKEVSV